MSVLISFAGKKRVGNYEKKGKSQSFRIYRKIPHANNS